MHRNPQILVLAALTLGVFGPGVAHALGASGVAGRLTDPQGRLVSGATISLLRRADASRREVRTDEQGQFAFEAIEPGEYRLTAESPGFPILTRTIVAAEHARIEDLQFAELAVQNQSVTVSANASAAGPFAPDPAQRIMVRDETLDANPGRPGMPVSIPGMPVESPAGGVKPPQYFAPGVAGDHGEPIAMFLQIGGFLFPNNLPANAHGNGYSDPNVIIPIAIESVQTDGGAFNVREGNHSVNSAVIFGLRDRLEPMVRLTADYRDVNLVAGWAPKVPANKAWAGLEMSYGNGFLKRLEHRRQYKGNVSKVFTFGRHDFTVYGIGYYGFAYQPGLIPIDMHVPDDTIDARQREETSNAALIFDDIWRLTDRRRLEFSGFYRYYTLDVRPNFGDGWIRQSEHRNVNSEEVLYTERYNGAFSLMAGASFRRDAPRALDLDRADAAGVFQPVTANNLTLNFYSPYIAAAGTFMRFLHYNLGYRRDEVDFDNQDLYRPGVFVLPARQRAVTEGNHHARASRGVIHPSVSRLELRAGLPHERSPHWNHRDPRRHHCEQVPRVPDRSQQDRGRDRVSRHSGARHHGPATGAHFQRHRVAGRRGSGSGEVD